MFTIGIDFGTNSVRALVVRCADGAEFGSCVVDYPSGAQGVLLDPGDDHLARQHPGDYLFGLEQSVKGALAEAAEDARFRPAEGHRHRRRHDRLEPDPRRRDEPAPGPQREMEAQSRRRNAGSGRTTPAGARRRASPSSRAKHPPAIHRQMRQHLFLGMVLVEDLALPQRRARRSSRPPIPGSSSPTGFPSVLAGVADPQLVKRGVCAAGHKALYRDDWGGLPDKEFLALLDPAPRRPARPPLREGPRRHRARRHALPEWAARLGLPAGIPIAIGEFDVHYGAIGCGVSEGTLVKVIGTSTCDCAVVSAEKRVADIPGICGIVKGAILPGLLRHRGRPVGGRRHFQLVGRGRLRRRRRAPRAADRRGGAAEARPEPACSRSTGTTATAPSSSIRCCRACSSGRRSTRRAPKSTAR